jgi:hypothetical protein
MARITRVGQERNDVGFGLDVVSADLGKGKGKRIENWYLCLRR